MNVFLGLGWWSKSSFASCVILVGQSTHVAGILGGWGDGVLSSVHSQLGRQSPGLFLVIPFVLVWEGVWGLGLGVLVWAVMFSSCFSQIRLKSSRRM